MTDKLLLARLSFATMRHRHEEICDTYKKILHWIFQTLKDEKRPWGNFVDWLLTDSALCWINGKAGSGKSTLVRYVYGNKETRDRLDFWSNGAELHVANFFFWNSGSVE